MDKNTRKVIIWAVIFVVLIFVVGYSVKEWRPSDEKATGERDAVVGEYINKNGQEWMIPEGKYEFRVSSAEEYPRFISGVIDPLDVHVGDIQKMQVVISSDVPLTRVWAEIETDSDIEIVDMTLTEEKALTRDSFKNNPYLVDDEGRLIINGVSPHWTATFSGLIKQAQAQGVMEYVYEGEWTVRDTHTETYRTKFIAEDEQGRTDEMTLAWSDPVCYWESGSLVFNCTISTGVEGVDNVNMSLSNRTITLNGGTLAFNPNKTLIIGSGQIILSGGTIDAEKYLYYTDVDGDGYTPSAAMSTNSSSGPLSQKIRVYLLASETLDCRDNNAGAFPGQTNYYNVHRGDGSFDWNCNGTIEYKCDTLITGQYYNYSYTWCRRIGDTDYHESCYEGGGNMCCVVMNSYGNWYRHWGDQNYSGSACDDGFTALNILQWAADRH